MATLSLFQIVSKQLKESTYVSLEDMHKQLDMVGGGAGTRGAQVRRASGVLGSLKRARDPTERWFSPAPRVAPIGGPQPQSC